LILKAGRYLYFLSDRNYAPQISSREWNFATNRMTGIYALALREDVENPFPPKSDEVSMEEEKEDNEKDGTNVEVQKLYIDFDGLADRVTRLPIDFENISGLNANKGHIFYVTSGQAFYGRSSYEPRKLNVFSMEEREGSVLVEDVGPYVFIARRR
jgi:tricorn protease